MARTYLQLVNDVLIRLRETAVTTAAASSYSQMVGAFINDAKREVEDAWQWSGLLDYFTITASTGQVSYETTGAPTWTSRTLSDRTRLYIDDVENIPLLFCTTSNYESRLSWEPTLGDFVNKQVAINQGSPAQNIPAMWQIYPSTINTTPGLWNKTVYLYYPPNSTANGLTYRCYVVNPQVELVNDSDTLIVPYAPVVQKAYLYCLYERGEELGETITLTQQKVEDTLSNAIVQDQQTSQGYMQIAIPYGGQY